MKMNKTLIVVGVLAIILILSCKDKKNRSANIEYGNYQNCRLLVYSSFGCYYDIKFDEKGSGILTTAYQKENVIDGKNANHDSIVGNNSFKISSINDILKIDTILESMKLDEKRISNHMHDAFHFILSVDGKVQVDVYGEDKQLNQLLEILINYFDKNLIDRCSFFSLFKERNRVDTIKDK